MRYNNKGLTLVEVLIAMGIMGIVMTSIFSFFIPNLKTFNRTDNHIQAQNNAQTAMNRIVDDIIGGQGVARTTNPVIFKINDTKFIKYEHVDETLKRGEGTSQMEITIEEDPFANNITEFRVEQTEANGVIITITSKINDSVVPLTNEIYFRNGN
ncbi:PilW family protein [Anaeromicrobium sediminis]|nr:prepilin-type N-terminal cleavage/methylation domain-containing protein [Anaeromicrobium sediminis]